MEISSRKNALIKEYRLLCAERKARRKSGFFPCEGAKLCAEAIKSGCELGRYAFVTKTAEKKYSEIVTALAGKCDIITVTDDVAEYISDTKSPQGIFITVRTLDKTLNLSTIDNSRQFIILENLQDVGNVGAIIRTCDAFGIDGIIMSESCADPFSPKAVRSTMGSLFRVPVYFSDIPTAVQQLRENKFTVYAAMLDKDAEQLGKVKFPEKTAVVIGNEGNGVTDEVCNACDKSLFIPMSSAESLNASVAASIIAWELKRTD